MLMQMGVALCTMLRGAGTSSTDHHRDMHKEDQTYKSEADLQMTCYILSSEAVHIEQVKYPFWHSFCNTATAEHKS